MARVKRGVAAHKRHKRLLAQAEGRRGTRSKLVRPAREALFHALVYAYRDRRDRKRDMRRLWIERINGQDTKAVVVSASQGTVILDQGGKKSTLDSDDNLVSGYSIIAGREVSYTPDLGTLSFPLKKGKSWTNHWTWKAGDYSGEGTTYGKAVAWETVTVPAGTFSALRVDVSYRSVVPIDSTCWYAPEVNGFVKCDITMRAQEKTTLELLSYQPAQNTAER